MIKFFHIISLLLVVKISSFAQSGTLDPAFGQNGKVVTNIDQTRNIATSVLVQPDGKIVVGGYSTPVDNNAYFTLVRYNSDGTLDNNFGSIGVVRPPVGTSEDLPFSIVLQPDGKIITAGYSWNGANYDFAMVRYDSDGNRDLAFGTSGMVTTDFRNSNDKANKVLLQPDGKIVIAGCSELNNDLDAALSRYLPNGTLDMTFGSSGKVVINIGELGTWQFVRSVAIQIDGKILAVGHTQFRDLQTDSLSVRFALIRLNSSGNFDNSFGSNGIVQTAIQKHDIGYSIAIQDDNKILLLGKTNPEFGGFDDFALVRYNSNGSVDNTFGNNGVVLTTFDNTDDIPASMVLQTDGKILAFGFTARNNGSTLDFAMARYNPDGTLDNSFGTNGKVITDFAGNWDFGTGMALQKDGKIVVTGYTKNGNDYDFALARYINDVALPVELVSFTAQAIENDVQLNWKTASEENSESFEIQRSQDGKLWNVLGNVLSVRNSLTENKYAFADFNVPDGHSLYRLKMIDQDQTYTYSSIQMIDVNKTAPAFSVYPNPTQDKIYPDPISNKSFKSLALFTADGKQVYFSDKPVDEIDIRHLQAGLYTLVLTQSDGAVRVKQIVKL